MIATVEEAGTATAIRAARRRLPLVAWRASASATAARVIVALCSVAAGLGVAVTSARVIGAIPGAVAAGWSSAAGSELRWGLAGAAVAFVMTHALAALADTVDVRLRHRVDRAIRQRIMELANGVAGVAHLEDPETLSLFELARGSGPTGIGPGLGVTGWFGLATVRASGLVAGIWLATMTWWLPVVAALGAVPLARRFSSHIMGGVGVLISATAQRRRSSYLADLALRPAAAKELRVFGLGGWLTGEHRVEFERATASTWVETARARRRLVAPMVASGVASAVAWLGVIDLAASGVLSLGDLALAASLLGQLRGGILTVSNDTLHVEHGATGLPALEALERRLSTDPLVHLKGDAPSQGLPSQHVRFEKVSFSYPGADRPVYEGLDLTIEAGRSLAVVGVNGAGKTTLVKLLARLYDPTSGGISVDGIPLTDLDPRAWQARVSAIFQDFVRYELSARDNVAFGAGGDTTGCVDEDDLVAAASDAGVAAAINRLPHGWSTYLSRQYEGGAELSGGQWQRLALARALLAVRSGAGILVLDEPTANLDVRAEAELYDRFLELTRGVTTLVISHRFSTVRRADRIVVIDQGRVVEDGTHDELVALGGRYATAFSAQASRFADQPEAN